MGKFDSDREAYLPIFWESITERQRNDYELAKNHFGPLYRVQDTNYFMKKFKAYQEAKDKEIDRTKDNKDK